MFPSGRTLGRWNLPCARPPLRLPLQPRLPQPPRLPLQPRLPRPSPAGRLCGRGTPTVCWAAGYGPLN
ncbi:hypothetical protein D1871_17710 [Nakamurella silvestris]|nr:hypothetical protein D1871_17710 [Nakamurella silvestris]